MLCLTVCRRRHWPAEHWLRCWRGFTNPLHPPRRQRRGSIKVELPFPARPEVWPAAVGRLETGYHVSAPQEPDWRPLRSSCSRWASAYLAAEYAFFRYTDDYAASTATTGTVAIGGSTAGNIERAGDADWFRVLLTEGTTYRFHLEGSDTAQGTLQYPVLRLLDGAGRVLHTDSGSLDGPGPGWTSVLSYTAPSTGPTTFHVRPAATTQGTYRISATDAVRALEQLIAGGGVCSSQWQQRPPWSATG